MGHPITAAEYSYLLARGRHAKRWTPEHPEREPAADPRQPVDWLRVKLPKARK